MDAETRYDDAELIAAFDELFPHGFAAADVVQELVMGNYEESPLFALFHPSAKQQHEEALNMHRGFARLRKEGAPEEPEPLFDENAIEEAAEVNVEEEVARLVGLAIWDIFSDNHKVSGSDGRTLEMGSHRASAGWIAEAFNRQLATGLLPDTGVAARAAAMDEQILKMMPESSGMEMYFKMMRAEQSGPYRYTDFYMGTAMMNGRADLTPLYTLIFRRLKAQGYDWKYVFPRLLLVDMRPLKERLDVQNREESGEPEWANYDPATAFEKDEADREKDAEIAETRGKLDEAYRESVEAAQDQPPPKTVAAYEMVYGEWPEGWPPE